MNLYEPKHLADSMRVVRKNTIAIAEDILEAQYDYRPTHDSRSVRETLLHMASMTLVGSSLLRYEAHLANNIFLR